MRKITTLGIVVIALTVTAGLAVAGPSDPLDCKCETGETGSGYTAHYYPLDGSGTRAYRCGSNGCHINMYANTCSGVHTGCGEGFAAIDLDSESESVRTGVVNLASRADVVYNVERSALQLVGCNGELMGHIAITDHERDVVMGVRLALAL